MAKKISKEMMELFVNAETLGELRNAYLMATLKYNTPKLLEQSNTLYIEKFDMVKDYQRTLKGKVYKKPTDEVVSYFLNAAQVLKGLENIECSLEGNWIWVTGDTKPIKDALKHAGFFYSAKRKAWYMV